jgi:hypothetical protein
MSLRVLQMVSATWAWPLGVSSRSTQASSPIVGNKGSDRFGVGTHDPAFAGSIVEFLQSAAAG